MNPTILHRISVPFSSFNLLKSHCESTQDRCYLSKKEYGLNYTLKGVPAKVVTIYLSDCFPSQDERDLLVLEIGRKQGSLDNAERDSLALRIWPGNQSHWNDSQNVLLPILQGNFFIVRQENSILLAVSWQDGGWCRTYQCLRSSLEGYNLSRIVMWHWNRWYDFLPFEEANSLAQSFESLHPELRSMTLAEANRLASRDLYRLARNLGWRKLTLRERHKFGIDCHWIKQDDNRFQRPANGAGQYSNEAAIGIALHPIVDDGDKEVRTSYGNVVVQ